MKKFDRSMPYWTKFCNCEQSAQNFGQKNHNHETSPTCRIFVLNLYETPFHTNKPFPIKNKCITQARAGCLSKFERGKDISAGVINIRDCYQGNINSIFKNNLTDFLLECTAFLMQEPTQAFLSTIIRQIHKWLSTRY